MSRDITLGETIYIDFTTRAFATGVPTTLSGTPVLSVLEENNATPITSGVSISVNRASVTGLNMGTIVATGGNGYEAGKGYSLYVSTGTVGGVSVVGEKVGEFTIEASAAFARLGAPAGASVSADIADLPTVSEFNARTLVAANYFDFTSDAVQVGTNNDKTGYSISGTLNTLDDLENLAQTDVVTSGAIQTAVGAVVNVGIVQNLNTIDDGAIKAATIEAGALNGKGDWNIGKTDYVLTQTFPANFADMSITLTTGLVDITQAAADKSWSTTTRVLTAGTNLNDLSAAQVNNEVLDVLTVDTFAELGGVPAATSTILDKISWVFSLSRNKWTQTNTTVSLRNDAQSGDIATAAVSDDNTTFTRDEYS